jgi:pyruvate,water dikinase
MVKGVSIFREILLDIGEELKDSSRLDKKEDVFFINIKDIRTGEKLQKYVLENRKKYEKELKRKSVPRVLTSTGETFFYSKIQNNYNKNIGIPVSSGIYEGQVKILENPKDRYKLEKGDILVTKATNPTWTTLFLEIGGLITEMGGPMSHGSVVAREYGIPAVSGIIDATIKYKDGQIIRINGETGEVELIKS